MGVGEKPFPQFSTESGEKENMVMLFLLMNVSPVSQMKPIVSGANLNQA